MATVGRGKHRTSWTLFKSPQVKLLLLLVYRGRQPKLPSQMSTHPPLIWTVTAWMAVISIGLLLLTEVSYLQKWQFSTSAMSSVFASQFADRQEQICQLQGWTKTVDIREK